MNRDHLLVTTLAPAEQRAQFSYLQTYCVPLCESDISFIVLFVTGSETSR